MSFTNSKLPFLRVRDLPDSFAVAVCGFDEEYETRFGKTSVLRVKLLGTEKATKANPEPQLQIPIKGSPPDNVLNLSETAKTEFNKMGYTHARDLIGKIVWFKKESVGGFSSKTIVPTEITNW